MHLHGQSCNHVIVGCDENICLLKCIHIMPNHLYPYSRIVAISLQMVTDVRKLHVFKVIYKYLRRLCGGESQRIVHRDLLRSKSVEKILFTTIYIFTSTEQ
jgi:hypothetical protein